LGISVDAFVGHLTLFKLFTDQDLQRLILSTLIERNSERKIERQRERERER
jgi:hypothetical protein